MLRVCRRDWWHEDDERYYKDSIWQEAPDKTDKYTTGHLLIFKNLVEDPPEEAVLNRIKGTLKWKASKGFKGQVPLLDAYEIEARDPETVSHREALDNVDKDPRYTTEGKRDRKRELRTKLSNTLENEAPKIEELNHLI